MKNFLVQIFNYFFPPEAYDERKITDVKWFQRFTPFAPYTVIFIALFILLWGILSPHPTKFYLKPQFIIFLGIAFWITLISIVVKMMRKKRRDPAFFLLIASFIAVRGLLALIIFSAFNPMIEEAKGQMELKKQKIAQEVQEKLQSHSSSWDHHSAMLEKRSREIQDQVAKAFSELDSRMGSRLDRFRRRERENDAAFWKIVEENRENQKTINANFWKSSEKVQARVHQWKRDWCRTHRLSQMCKGLPPAPDAVDTVQKEEVKWEEKTTCIDLPLFFKYKIRE